MLRVMIEQSMGFIMVCSDHAIRCSESRDIILPPACRSSNVVELGIRVTLPDQCESGPLSYLDSP